MQGINITLKISGFSAKHIYTVDTAADMMERVVLLVKYPVKKPKVVSKVKFTPVSPMKYEK
jgi:hypothetical protein